MLYCISGIVGLQLNILLMCIKSVGRIAYYHRGHIALKHGSDWNIPMSEFHLASVKLGGYGYDSGLGCSGKNRHMHKGIRPDWIFGFPSGSGGFWEILHRPRCSTLMFPSSIMLIDIWHSSGRTGYYNATDRHRPISWPQARVLSSFRGN